MRPSFSLGRPNSVSGAPFSVCQMPSMAAILAGWCSSVLRPCRSPMKICSGITTATAVMAVRRALRVPSLAVPLMSCQALTPAIKKPAVRADASSLWPSR
ncbi:hypothetical protein D3C71_1536810 [compost metagenome]